MKSEAFYDKYNWKGINYQSEKDHWRKFQKNSPKRALKVLYIKDINTYIAYFSKDSSNHSFSDSKWHYLAAKRLSALLRGITSKHDGGFYCLNCFHSFRTKKQS